MPTYYPGYPPQGNLPMRPEPMMAQPPWQGAMAPQMPPPQPMQAVQQPGFTVRPVTSREEAVATPTDYFGAGVLMPDLSHGMIYLKQFDGATGASKFAAFAYAAPAQQATQTAAEPQQGYDAREDVQALREELEALKARVDGPKTIRKGAAE